MWNLRGRARRGQSMVEFALLMPVIVLMFMAVFDLARAFWVYNDVSNAVREGARYATYDNNTDNIKTATAQYATTGLLTSQVTVTCYSGYSSSASTKTCSSVTFGDAIKVQATKAYQPLTGKLTSLIGSSVNITATSMRSFQ
jgi:Flp pilus assembly protein TadG